MAKKRSSKTSIKNYAYIALIVSGVALLASALFGLFKLVLVLDLYTLQNDQWVNTALYISLGMILVGLAVYALITPESVRDFFTGRQGRYGSNAAVNLIAFLAIIVVANMWAYAAPVEALDLTEDLQHTLAPETLDTLRLLNEPVHAIAFYTQESTQIRELLENMESSSNGKFDFEFVNPDTNPARALEYEITSDRTIVLVMGDRREAVTYPTEQAIVNALMRLMNPGERVVYFVTGHGEHSPDESGENGLTRLQSTLTAKNYVIHTLNLLAENQIPADAQALIIAGPAQPLSSEEVDLIIQYLDQGGSLILLSESPLYTGTADRPDPLSAYLAANWNISLNNDIVIDPSLDQVIIAVSASYGDHPIVQNIQTTNTYYPIARSLTIGSGAADVQTTVLVSTVNRAWGETNLTEIDQGYLQFNAGVDTAGPVVLAAVSENLSTGGRVIVFGDSDFATDSLFDVYGNGNIITNAVDYAAGQEDYITLTQTARITRRLSDDVNQGTILILGASFICLLPLLIVVGGVASWLMRRAQG
ncbi:MAG: Gldg family protein [Anaerolineales bacterium]